jgi:ABC-type Zn uptake system ZnuABC Zn-binding protein ZnuA
MRRFRMVGVYLAAAAVLGAACGDDGQGGPAADSGRLQVVATVSPITSIAANIGGDLVDIAGLVPGGTDSHTFEPTPSVAQMLSQADVLFINGLGLEEPIAELAQTNLPEHAELVSLGEQTITPDEYVYDFSFPEERGSPNPHLWTSPPLAKRYGEIIKDTLSQADPDNAAAYAGNYDAFAAKVDELDQAMVGATETVPPDQRMLLTYHDSWPYFAEHYGWEVIGAIQPSHFGEPTAAEVADLARQIEEKGVPAIFGSEVFPSPVLEQLGRQTGVRYVDELEDDDLPGAPGDDEHSWFGLMQNNFVTMVDALGGDASVLEAVDISIDVPDHAHYPQ